MAIGHLAAIAAHTVGTFALRFATAALEDKDVQAKFQKVAAGAAKQLINAAGERSKRNLADRVKKNWSN